MNGVAVHAVVVGVDLVVAVAARVDELLLFAVLLGGGAQVAQLKAKFETGVSYFSFKS